jgi:hypothetical protein
MTMRPFPRSRAQWTFVGFVVLHLIVGCAAEPTSDAPGNIAQDVPGQQAALVWRQAISTLPVPDKGCFHSTSPEMAWHAVPCAENRSIPPLIPAVAGNGSDFTLTSTGTIRTARGSFPSVTGVTGESDSQQGSNAYSLQINTNTIMTAACNGALDPSRCSGWQQFVYLNPNGFLETGSVFMQYWLIGYNKTCPAGWMQNKQDCYKNSSITGLDGSPLTTTIDAKNLSTVYLVGTASATAGIDQVVFGYGNDGAFANGQDSVLGLGTGQAWRSAEFNVFGYGSLSKASFNAGATIAVALNIVDGTSASPTVVNDGMNGTTGETNNFTLVPASGCPSVNVDGRPMISFVESTASPLPSAPFCLLNDIVPIGSSLF